MPHSIRAAMLTGYPELARSVGLDPLRMLDAAGIPREAMADADLRFPTVAARDLLELSSRAAEDFGLRLSEMRTPSIMGPVTLIAREQPTVRAVLETVTRHHGLHSDATTVLIEDAGDVTIVRIVQTWPTPGPERQAVELSMGQMMRVLRNSLGVQWRPLSAAFVHAAPMVLDTHRRIFGPQLLFDQDFNGVVCARADIDRANPTADPEMARQAERYIARLDVGQEARLPDKVNEVVVGLLPTGRCNIDRVANQLGVDPRTLQRQLSDEGTSFLDIVQAARMALTHQYLDQSDRPLVEVAELLGFSALSAFSRWHRTHYGRSASDRREALRTGQASP